MNILEKNTIALDREIEWFQGLVDRRVQGFFNAREPDVEYVLPTPPDLQDDDSHYGQVVKKYNLGLFERALLILTLLPHIKPEVLDIFYSKNANYNREFTEFGGLKGNIHVGFLPTAETAAFILAGKNLKKRFALQMLLEESSPIRKNQIIIVDSASGSDPFFSRPLRVSKEFLSYLTTGEIYKPDFSPSFPAALLTTKMGWEDLVLDHDVLEEVEEIYNWIKFGDTLLNTGDLGKKLKKGYRGLFYGPPGTGKTLTATLLGKANGLDVYRIDLSMVVSKYIGETEKNLSSIFDMAENKNWILFFDEADSLFGKRTATKDSKDRYANQEISYLLQRIEDFPGIIILATNLKANIDDAFARRFQSMIYFPIPSYSLRVDLWKKAFGKDFELDGAVDIYAIAKNYELSGGAITNVLRYCGLKAISRNSKTVMKEDILAGIRKEMIKEGKTIQSV